MATRTHNHDFEVEVRATHVVGGHPLRLVRDDDCVVSFDALIDAAQRAEVEGERTRARALYESALSRLSEARSGARGSDVIRWIARTHRADANLELALDCAEAALAVADAHGDEAARGHATNLQAIIHTQLGELDEAERLYHLARESALRAGEAKLSAMTAQNLGVIANVRGDLDTALQYYETSLAAYRTLGLASDVSIALNNLGLLYTQRRQWTDAARSYDEAIRVAQVLGDQKACVQIDVNRAECLVAQNRYDEARQACERASVLSRRITDSGALGELHKALGIVERETGNYSRAEECLARAHEIATQRQDLLLLAETTKEFAELYLRQGRNRDTLQTLNQAHRLFTQLRARRELADVGRRMGRLESDFLDVVRRWGDSIESVDAYTQGHCERVAEMACALAARAGMDEQSLFWFRIGALLHDVGKLVIPPELLNKPSALSDEEWALIRRHPSAGV
ncbi:MAG: tetratricopeptide repeat protein, partial [Gemmatimonadaceae bacterium]